MAGDKDSCIEVFRKFAHTAETSFITAEIKTIEAQDLRQRYHRKKAAKTNRKVISKARVITATEMIKIWDERLEKERLAAEQAVAKAAKKKQNAKEVCIQYQPLTETPANNQQGDC
jgi:hypothetical protein